MADVFISYSQKDRAVAKALADKLTGKGVSVWWDTELVGGESFRDVIEEQLEAAKVVIVLWSNNSRASRFVQDEADVAAAQGKLVSALLDGFTAKMMPLGFRTIQSVGIGDVNGIERALGKRGISAIEVAPVSTTQQPDNTPPDTMNDASREDEAWKFVSLKNDARLYEEYAKAFPNSKNRVEAESQSMSVWPLVVALLFIFGGPIILLDGIVKNDVVGVWLGGIITAIFLFAILKSKHSKRQFLRIIKR